MQVRNDDLKHNPSLQAFEDLPDSDRSYDYNMALKTLMTLVALGYQISTEELDFSHVRYLDLPADKYVQSNGYLPRPLNLDAIDVPENLTNLVEKLADNAHSIWAAGRIAEGWTYGKANVSSCCGCCGSLDCKPVTLVVVLLLSASVVDLYS